LDRKGGEKMKAAIHPKYFQAKVRCNCGNEFVTGSTKEEIRIEVCSKCHPFYTGSQKLLLEAGGRVEKFKKKYNRD
jgi:large subunit ribosomal protein L31